MKEKVDLNDINSFHIFSIDLERNGNEFRLFRDSYNTICIEVSGIYTDLCPVDEYNEYVVFKNKRCYVDGKECIITAIDYETIAEFNAFCERCEMEEW